MHASIGDFIRLAAIGWSVGTGLTLAGVTLFLILTLE